MPRNTRQKIVFYSALTALAAAVALWGLTGFSLFTRQQIPVEKYDDILGTTYVEWQDVFMVGLDIIGPVCAAIVLIALVTMRVLRTRISTSDIAHTQF